MAYDTWEAARLISWANKQAGLRPLTEAELTEWLHAGVGGLEWAYTYEEEGEVTKYIDFPTLISLRLICLLHFDRPDFPSVYSNRVVLKDITEAMPKLRRELGIKWPFASKTLWNMHDKNTAVSVGKFIDPKAEWERIYWQLCGERLKWHTEAGLDYGEDSVAYAWLPAKGVVIDARVVSGSPCVKGTRTPTWAFTGMLKGGGNIEELSDGYRLTKEQVLNALDWERQLDSAGA